MVFQRNHFFQQFSRFAFSLLITVCLLRIYEYYAIASKSFVGHAYSFELAGLLYDIWLWLIYSAVLFIPFLLFYLFNKTLATIVFHCANTILIVCYLALLVTFSERTTPFDHEFFTRNSHESLLTVKQMMTSGIKLYIPFILYILLYYVLYYKLLKKITVPRTVLWVFAFLAIAAVAGIKYSNPSPGWFKQSSAYHLVSNKLAYWLHDSYHYLTSKDKYESHKLTNKELEKEVLFYQKNQPFEFNNSEYPLLHTNNEPDVLGGFFDLKPALPNIVILVVEGLSRDFSGENAYAGSFTPFLDSLSKKSLVWDNFLSTAPGTFAAHPAISGSLPYGKRGFSIMNVMPDHLSLIKILRSNGYFTNFMIGFNPDFDNMGGYIRLQGTDFILSKYGPKYKQMGVGEEGWSMGYPDDALFSRSFEVLDSIKRTPYLSIYHTATSHLPYLFEQKPFYNSLFDKKIRSMTVSKGIKRTLRATKNVLATFMFADDCIRKFFNEYSKRPEYDNTIFFITGDHHIGSFPSTGDIDDYHVPFIVYSPMLKKPQKFLSVNSHNNIAPTILALLSHNYKLNWQPQEVHWLGGVMDTCASFRNIQSMAFMSWSREIEDYIYKDYFISGNQLYKLTPDLLEEEYENDSVKNQLIRLRENFRIINSYVCDNNKIYPGERNLLPGNKELIFEYTDSSSRSIFSKSYDTSLVAHVKVPGEFKYIYVEFSTMIKLDSSHAANHPGIRFALIDTKEKNHAYLYWSKRDIVTLSKNNFVAGQWNTISANDMFTLDDYRTAKNLGFEVAVYAEPGPIKMEMQKMKILIYGIK